MEYRLLKEKDIPAIRHFKDDQNTVYDPAQLGAFLRQENSFGFVAAQGDKILGFAYGYLLPKPDGSKVFYTHSVDVTAEEQGRGYGTGLVEYISGYARELGCTKMFLIVDADNPSAMRCYEKADGKRGADASYVYSFR